MQPSDQITLNKVLNQKEPEKIRENQREPKRTRENQGELMKTKENQLNQVERKKSRERTNEICIP